MKLVVGLGNPGRKYAGTRHNIGFEVLNELAQRFPGSSPTIKSNAEIVETSIQNEKVLLVAPQTYMNLSGDSVQPLMKFYKPELNDLIVICDDMNLDIGRIRFRASGSAGGQNGLAHILQKLATNDVHRLRIGVGRPPARVDSAAYVLGKFFTEERDTMAEVVKTAADGVECWIAEGITPAMNKFNTQKTAE